MEYDSYDEMDRTEYLNERYASEVTDRFSVMDAIDSLAEEFEL